MDIAQKINDKTKMLTQARSIYLHLQGNLSAVTIDARYGIKINLFDYFRTTTSASPAPGETEQNNPNSNPPTTH